MVVILKYCLHPMYSIYCMYNIALWAAIVNNHGLEVIYIHMHVSD